MAATKKLTKNQERNLIDRVYNENCRNIQINIMDIGKIFAEGHKALAEGRDLKTTIVEFVEKIRTDKPIQPTV